MHHITIDPKNQSTQISGLLKEVLSTSVLKLGVIEWPEVKAKKEYFARGPT